MLCLNRNSSDFFLTSLLLVSSSKTIALMVVGTGDGALAGTEVSSFAGAGLTCVVHGVNCGAGSSEIQHA